MMEALTERGKQARYDTHHSGAYWEPIQNLRDRKEREIAQSYHRHGCGAGEIWVAPAPTTAPTTATSTATTTAP